MAPIESDPNVMMGKPVVAGTRITVELILERLAGGESVDQLLEAHPRLTREAIQEALSFAARVLKADVYPLGPAGAKRRTSSLTRASTSPSSSPKRTFNRSAFAITIMGERAGA
ncbi:MAG: DUF433 domain-containing protein [Myxococcales bacterium]|nr:DUF433 domain-containing protein [Myxococcales bacterium]